MKSVLFVALLALGLSGCGKVDADPVHPKPGGCSVCDLDLSQVTERPGFVCNANELLRGHKLDALKAHVSICVKPVCKCCQ